MAIGLMNDNVYYDGNLNTSNLPKNFTTIPAPRPTYPSTGMTTTTQPGYSFPDVGNIGSYAYLNNNDPRMGAGNRTTPYSVYTTPKQPYSALPNGGNISYSETNPQSQGQIGAENSSKDVYAKPAYPSTGMTYDASQQPSSSKVPPNQLGKNLLNFATSGSGQALGRGLLEASGYSATPISFGQALSQGLNYLSEFNAQNKKDQFERDKFEYLQKQDAIANDLKMKEIVANSNKPTELMRNLQMAGIDPSSTQGQQIITDYLTKSQVNIDQKTDSQIEVNKFNLGADLVKENKKVVQENKNINSKLSVAKSLIENGKIPDTNKFTGLKKSIASSMNALGMLDEGEQEELSNLETFDALIAYMVPRMRAVGSGSTSDFEVQMYQLAAASMSNTPDANLKIIAGFQQFNDYNVRYTEAMEKWLYKNNNLEGFEADWVSKNGTDVFLQYTDQESFDELVSSGRLQKNQFVTYLSPDGAKQVIWWDGK